MSYGVRRTHLPATVIVLLSLVLAACGGASTGASSTDSSTTSSTPAATSTTSTTAPTTTLPPTTTTTTQPAEFATVEGTAPHALASYAANLSIEMTLPEATIEAHGTGVYTPQGFSCDWSVDVLGQTASQVIMGSPTTVWITGSDTRVLPAASAEALSAQQLCPSSPVFWAGFGSSTDGGDPETRNDIPSRRVDATDHGGALPGMELGQVPGITVEQATIWVADPGGWVSAIEVVLSVGPDAATSIWSVPFDPEAGPTEMIYRVDIFRPDDTSLEVSLPESVDFSLGYRDVTVVGAALPVFVSGSLDTAIQTTAPTITGTDWNDVSTTITADGRPKIILFLAHWCPHCQDEVPEVNQWLEEGHLPDTVDMYSITVMTDFSKSNWPPQDWLIAEDWQLPVIMDDAMSSAAFAFGVQSVPAYVVLDGNNAVLVRVSGGVGVEGLDTLVRIALGE
ncbi:MAG: TlpA disulfide reductase family protein [Actinomycetota bacterium]|nr:TlpA disulfide reductase family protein [Actinomycetota bacterium]